MHRQLIRITNRMKNTGNMTPKQEAFCLAYLETGNASEAYRRSYSTQAMAATSVNREAASLLRNPKITARLGELRSGAEVKAILTLEAHMNELRVLRDLAKQNGQYSAAIKAEELRGKLCKFYVDQREPPSKEADPIQSEGRRLIAKEHMAAIRERFSALRAMSEAQPIKIPNLKATQTIGV